MAKKCAQCLHWSRDQKGARPWGRHGGLCSVMGLTTHESHYCGPKDWEPRYVTRNLNKKERGK